MSRPMSKLERMAIAIMEWEGYYKGSRSYTNNNPGNLKWAGQENVKSADPDGHAIFGTFQSGWNALVKQIEMAATGLSKNFHPDMTLKEFFKVYAGLDKGYAAFVAKRLSVKVTTRIKELL